jgi:hypothetical protein
MNKQSHHKGELTQHPTCDNCVHTIRKKGGHGMVVCLAHLKDMPGKNSQVCELHAMKKYGPPGGNAVRH